MMMGKRNTPIAIVEDDEAPMTSPPQTPLEKFLNRRRDATGKLIPKKKRAASRTVAASRFDKTLAETQKMVDTGEWDDVCVRHLVALYCIMHIKCYRVDAAMSGTERYNAMLMAGGFVKRNFADDIIEALKYFQWVWTRELGREKWCRENRKERGRLSFKVTLSNAILTDYRVAMARRK